MFPEKKKYFARTGIGTHNLPTRVILLETLKMLPKQFLWSMATWARASKSNREGAILMLEIANYIKIHDTRGPNKTKPKRGVK